MPIAIMRGASTLMTALLVCTAAPSSGQGVIDTGSQEANVTDPLSVPSRITIPPPRYEEACPVVKAGTLNSIVRKFNLILSRDEIAAFQREIDVLARLRCRDQALSFFFLRLLASSKFGIKRQ